MNNPMYYAVVWWGGDGRLIGTMLELQDYLQNLKHGYELQSFAGRTATVCILSKDKEITREQKLDFAVMFMKGMYQTIYVNLRTLESETVIGSQPPCY